MPAFMLLALLLTTVEAQGHTTGQRHVHLSCPGDEHCTAVPTGGDQLPVDQTVKPKSSDKGTLSFGEWSP